VGRNNLDFSPPPLSAQELMGEGANGWTSRQSELGRRISPPRPAELGGAGAWLASLAELAGPQLGLAQTAACSA